MKKNIKAIFKTIFLISYLIISFISPVLFPLLGLYAIDNSLKILIITSCIYSIIYIITSPQRLLSIIIFSIISFFSVKTYKTYNPFILTLIYIPLFDFIIMILNIITSTIKYKLASKELTDATDIEEYEKNFFEELKKKNAEYDNLNLKDNKKDN